MLYTDRFIVDPATLMKFDGQIQEAADASELDLSSACRAAVSDISAYLLSRIQNATPFLGGLGVSASHVAAVNNVGISGNTPRCRLEQIVVDSWSGQGLDTPIKLWAVHFALFHIYREISNRKVLDLYENRAIRYAEEKRDRWVWLQSTGLPVLVIPFPAPAADMWPNAGYFDSTDISLAGHSGAIGGTFDVAVAYADSTGYNLAYPNRGNSESAPSPIVTVQVPADNVLVVNISRLNPPNGNPMPSGPFQGYVPTVKTTHWQVLAGPSGGPLYVQNPSLIPISQQSYQLNGDPAANNLLASQGQYPLKNMVMVDSVMLW